MRTQFVLLAALMLAAPILAATASATELNARLGAWEMTTQLHMDGPVLSPEMLAQLPPQARAQVEAALGGAQKPHTNRTCMTPEKLKRGFNLNQGHENQCDQQVVSSGATLMEIRGTCQEHDGTLTMHARIALITPEQMEGHFDMDRPNAAEGPKHMTGEITGHWVAADCGGADDN